MFGGFIRTNTKNITYNAGGLFVKTRILKIKNEHVILVKSAGVCHTNFGIDNLQHSKKS
jgi:hypothetical protein